jgi:hypothetical protein
VFGREHDVASNLWPVKWFIVLIIVKGGRFRTWWFSDKGRFGYKSLPGCHQNESVYVMQSCKANLFQIVAKSIFWHTTNMHEKQGGICCISKLAGRFLKTETTAWMHKPKNQRKV